MCLPADVPAANFSLACPCLSVVACLPEQDTVAPATGSPTSVTVNVTVAAFLWLNDAGRAVRARPASTWVCQNQIGLFLASSRTLTTRSSRPDEPSVCSPSKMSVDGGGLSWCGVPNLVPAAFVRTTCSRLVPKPNQLTHR